MTVSLLTRHPTFLLGTARQQPILTQQIQTHDAKHAVHLSLNSMTGTAMAYSTGKMLMMTMTELSTCSISIGIATLTTMEIFTLSTVHCIVMTVQTPLIQTLMEMA